MPVTSSQSQALSLQDQEISTQPAPVNSLANAPEEIKLAVDLIYLLEDNQIDPKVALAALAIVKADLESKLSV